MANPSLAYGATTHTFDILRLPDGVAPFSDTGRVFRRFGVDGLGVHKMGRMGPAFVVHSMRGVTTAALAKTAVQNYELAPLNLATLTLDTGQTFTNVLIEKVSNVRYKAITGSGGYVDGASVVYEVRAAWTLRLTEDTAAGA